jgi:small subunit ribosomal protein S7e
MAGSGSQVGPQELASEDIEKKFASLNNVPLFMRSLPSEDTDDAVVAALQSLAYEGTPDGR